MHMCGSCARSLLACTAASSVTTECPLIQVPERLLMGPGPSNAHPAVLAAQSLPLLGAVSAAAMLVPGKVQQNAKGRSCWKTTMACEVTNNDS